jgi:FAD/FMN-containing dehydrogenase
MDKRFPIEDQIEMLAMSLRGAVISPRHPDYDEARRLTLGSVQRRPAAVVRVANAADVAATVNFARATGLELAVRSGGHSISGHGSCDGGIAIDLRGLDDLVIDHETGTAWVGTGLTSGEVTAEVERHGKIIGFGDSGTVGVGGITLGGGIGYMVRKYGLTIDSLLAAEVVTAAGDIVVADERNHPDLFWALRGGGGNFGIVTRFRYRLQPLPEFTGGMLVLPAVPEVVAGFAAAAEAAPEELTTIAMIMPLPPVPFIPPAAHGRIALVGMMAYAGNAADADAALAPFRSLATPLADMVRPGRYTSMYLPEQPAEVSIRSSFMDRIGVAEAACMIERIETCTAPMRMAQFRILGGAMARVAPGATAFAHRRSRIMTSFLAMYGDPSAAAFYDRWAEDALAPLRQTDRGAYVNFLARQGEDGLRAAYPEEVWQRLRQVKRQYDPENLFRLNQNIPPA